MSAPRGRARGRPAKVAELLVEPAEAVREPADQVAILAVLGLGQPVVQDGERPHGTRPGRCGRGTGTRATAARAAIVGVGRRGGLLRARAGWPTRKSPRQFGVGAEPDAARHDDVLEAAGSAIRSASSSFTSATAESPLVWSTSPEVAQAARHHPLVADLAADRQRALGAALGMRDVIGREHQEVGGRGRPAPRPRPAGRRPAAPPRASAPSSAIASG